MRISIVQKDVRIHYSFTRLKRKYFLKLEVRQSTHIEENAP